MIKKLLSILLIGALLLNTINQALAWSYPLKKISKSKCRFTDFDELSDDCKMDLPRIENADYSKYKSNQTYRLLYTVLWSSTYDNGWDIGFGSHLGVDIAVARGTPVYSIGDGTVELAGYSSGRGNAVVIKHKIDGKYVYSVYAHMDSVSTTKGATVKEGDVIGKVGHTGNAYGNHLHFQIDTNQTGFHPYYYNDCKGDVMSIVNDGLCKDKVSLNTIDPIYFIETNGKELAIAQTQEQITQIAENIKKEEQMKPSEIISRQEFMKTDLDYFLDKYDLEIKSYINGNTLNVGEDGVINFKLINKANPKKLFNDILPESVKIEYDNSILWASPTEMKFLEDGQRQIQIKGLKAGVSRVNIKMFNQIVKSYTIRVGAADQKATVKNAYIVGEGTPTVGGEYWQIAVMKDSNYNNIVKTNYDGTFTIKANSNVMLCNPGIKSTAQLKTMNNIKCDSSKLTDKITFKYSDTLEGLMLFKVLPKKTGNMELGVYNGNTKLGNNIVKQIGESPYLPDTDKYSSYVKKALAALYVRLYYGTNFYPDGNLKESDAGFWIQNTFPGSKSPICSSTKYLTRLEFLKLISDMTGLKGNSNKTYIDVTGENLPYANILYSKNILFLDDFGARFFQPDSKITRKEAAYILYRLATK